MSEYDDVCNQVADETGSQFMEETDRLRKENSQLKEECQTLGLDLDKALKDNSALKQKNEMLKKITEKTIELASANVALFKWQLKIYEDKLENKK